MTKTTLFRASLAIALINLSAPLVAHEGHVEEPNAFLHAVIHFLMDFAPLLFLIAMGLWVFTRIFGDSWGSSDLVSAIRTRIAALGIGSDRRDRD